MRFATFWRQNLSGRNTLWHSYQRRWLFTVIMTMAFALALGACSPAAPATQPAVPGAEQAALSTYVPGGKHDDSICSRPADTPARYSSTACPRCAACAITERLLQRLRHRLRLCGESREMMQGFTWGDTHHPALSETNGDYDGRWLFINDNANLRIAGIDLQTFQPIRSSARSRSVGARRPVDAGHRVCLRDRRASLSRCQQRPTRRSSSMPKYFSPAPVSRSTRPARRDDGRLAILLPPIDLDLADAGKKDSDGWVFFSSYNSEMATRTWRSTRRRTTATSWWR